jgi:uncharacterized protein YkwD
MKRAIAISSFVVFAGMVACSGGTDQHGADDVDVIGDNLGSVKSGEAQDNLSGTSRTQLRFSIDVPIGAKNLRFAMSGGTGNADLYVRFGTPPTRSAFDFISANATNDELIAPSAATPGTWFFMVRGRSSFSGASVVATFDPPPAPIDAGGPPPVPDATPPGGIDCQNAASWPADWVALEDQVLDLVNQQRAAGATCGTTMKPAVGPLANEGHLRQAARCHSLDMATHNYFSHDSQDGTNPFDRMVAAGYTQWTTLGENIAAGRDTAAGVMEQWMNSEGHCNNIMAGGFADIGIGHAFVESADFDHYWTQDFGHH